MIKLIEANNNDIRDKNAHTLRIKSEQRGYIGVEIYIGNIPKGTRPGELKKIIKEAIKQKVFPRLFEKIVQSGQLDKGVGIKIHKTKSTDGSYRYGHIVVNSHGLGKLTLDSLINAEIRGMHLNAREFIERRSDNDRRSHNAHQIPWQHNCRRSKERRQNL